MLKRSFVDQVNANNSQKIQTEENAVKGFSEKDESIKKPLKRTCVLVDPDTWEEFKRYSQNYGISASAQMNIFINKFIQKEQKKEQKRNEKRRMIE